MLKNLGTSVEKGAQNATGIARTTTECSCCWQRKWRRQPESIHVELFESNAGGNKRNKPKGKNIGEEQMPSMSMISWHNSMISCSWPSCHHCVPTAFLNKRGSDQRYNIVVVEKQQEQDSGKHISR